MCAAGIRHIQPPSINASLATDKVLVGEAVMLTCFIHLLIDSGVEMTWTTANGSQVGMALCCWWISEWYKWINERICKLPINEITRRLWQLTVLILSDVRSSILKIFVIVVIFDESLQQLKQKARTFYTPSLSQIVTNNASFLLTT